MRKDYKSNTYQGVKHKKKYTSLAAAIFGLSSMLQSGGQVYAIQQIRKQVLAQDAMIDATQISTNTLYQENVELEQPEFEVTFDMDQIVTNSLSKSLLQDVFGEPEFQEAEPQEVEPDWETSLLPQQFIVEEEFEEFEELGDEDLEEWENNSDQGIPDLNIQQVMVKELDAITGFVNSYFGEDEEFEEDDDPGLALAQTRLQSQNRQQSIQLSQVSSASPIETAIPVVGNMNIQVDALIADVEELVSRFYEPPTVNDNMYTQLAQQDSKVEVDTKTTQEEDLLTIQMWWQNPENFVKIVMLLGFASLVGFFVILNIIGQMGRNSLKEYNNKKRQMMTHKRKAIIKYVNSLNLQDKPFPIQGLNDSFSKSSSIEKR